jgi:hypothetical protein
MENPLIDFLVCYVQALMQTCFSNDEILVYLESDKYPDRVATKLTIRRGTFFVYRDISLISDTFCLDSIEHQSLGKHVMRDIAHAFVKHFMQAVAENSILLLEEEEENKARKSALEHKLKVIEGKANASSDNKKVELTLHTN